MNRKALCRVLASCVVVGTLLFVQAGVANAQCVACPTPVVAYQPVAVQQVRTGWYPGRFFDRLRMRRWGITPVAPTTTVAAAPVATAPVATTAAFTPYTAAFAYTAARPVVTPFAPLARTTFFAPAATTVARQVVMSPVVSSCSVCGCNPCCCDPCATAACPTCPTGVNQAVFTDSSSPCVGCAPAAGVPSYSSSPNGGGRPTPQPSLAPDEAVPDSSQYDVQRPATDDDSSADPTPIPEEDSSTSLEAPRLFDPRDRTASRSPTVDVQHAVYRQPASSQGISHSRVEVDAHGWYAVPPSR